MSITVVPLEYGVIDLTRTRRANAHPKWCQRLGSCEVNHIGSPIRGRSWYLHGEKPELGWGLEVKEPTNGSREAHVEGMLVISNKFTDEGLSPVALFQCTAGDARALSADLLKIADAIDAGLDVEEVSR